MAQSAISGVRTVRRTVVLIAVALLALALLVPAARAVRSAVTGAMTPAIGSSPLYRLAGHPNLSKDPVFSCQKEPGGFCYGPYQIRAAYGVDKLAKRGLDGAGTEITIIDAFQAPLIQHDLDNFDAAFGLPDTTVNIVPMPGIPAFDQNDPNQVGWSAETSLDVEWAHAIAPAAQINLVQAKSNDDADILAALTYVVDHNLGDVISQSYGEAEECMDPALLAAQHQQFRRAERKGMTVFASSGDQGAAQPTCDGSSYFKAASTPASDPRVTGVGGTILDANHITGAYQSETTWNEPQYGAGGGGGFSTVYAEPRFQRHAQHSGARGVPDISYNAAIDQGVLVAWSTSGQGADYFWIFGGTSAGSPQWAGLAALADQANGHRVGDINPALYALAGSPRTYTRMFHDITTGDNTCYCDTNTTIQGFAATRGWDAATGLGTPKADALVPALAGRM